MRHYEAVADRLLLTLHNIGLCIVVELRIAAGTDSPRIRTFRYQALAIPDDKKSEMKRSDASSALILGSVVAG